MPLWLQVEPKGKDAKKAAKQAEDAPGAEAGGGAAEGGVALALDGMQEGGSDAAEPGDGGPPPTAEDTKVQPAQFILK